MNEGDNPDQTEFILIISTTHNLKEAEKIAWLLVNEKIAACVSISAPIQSVYRWQGKVEKETEFMLVVKTVRNNFEKVESLIRSQHSYDIPEILGIPVQRIENGYGDWILQNTIDF